MLLSRNIEIISKIKFSFEFDDNIDKEIYLKTNDIAIIKFYSGNDIVTAQGKVIDILITNIEKQADFANITEEYKDAIIIFDCSKFYDGKLYKIFSRSIIDITIVETTPDLKGEPGESADLTEIYNKLDDINISLMAIDTIKENIQDLTKRVEKLEYIDNP